MQHVSASTARPPAQAVETRADAVVLLSCKADPPRSHELASQAFIGRGIAQLLHAGFEGHYDAARHHQTPSLYFVPDDTLTSLAAAHQLGIRNDRQLYGGVVPFPFVATKTITHPLLNARAQAPEGWSPEFAERVRTIVLPGYSAFSLRDAQAAALRLLRHGVVRLKEAGGVGGAGQAVIRKRDEVQTRLRALDEARVEREGVVLELNLARLVTYGVGFVRVGELTAAYFGEQKLTFNNHGKEVYGGSNFTVVRGDFDALARWAPSAVIKTAIEQARIYHEAAFASFPGMFASRCNYDVVQGYDATGRWFSGVLEQSWRLGGGSAAELAALRVFQADPSVQTVRASTTETYGPHASVPADADVYFSGVDEQVGPLTKYARLEIHDNP